MAPFEQPVRLALPAPTDAHRANVTAPELQAPVVGGEAPQGRGGPDAAATPPKKRGGRFGQRTIGPREKTKVLKWLKKGASYAQCSAFIGVDRQTLIQARREDPDFSARCRAVYETYNRRLERFIVKAAPEDWRAARAILGKRDPNVWGENRKKFEITGKGGGPVQAINVNVNAVQQAGLSVEEIDLYLKLMEKMEAAGVIAGPINSPAGRLISNAAASAGGGADAAKGQG